MNSVVHLFHNMTLMSKHKAPHGFPERPERLVGIANEIDNAKILDSCISHLVTSHATNEFLASVYGAHEIARWERNCAKAADKTIFDERHPDIYWSHDSMNAVKVAVAASLEATNLILDAAAAGRVEHAFAIVRPPGHHCFNLPAGFCIANNVALAAREAVLRGKRVGIVDWDYHFGDGTANEFLNTPEVSFCSLHCKKTRDGISTYPVSGLKGDELARRTDGRMFNIMWRYDDADNAAYMYAFQRCIVPAFRKFGCDIIFVSAGYDAIAGDSLAGMELLPNVFYDLSVLLKSLGVPVVCILEGGYNPTLLGRGVASTIRGLLSGAAYEKNVSEIVSDDHKATVDRVAESLHL